ncbi:hypothetical protein Sulac_1481 [Sulfobacillus acidophilus DSM 10332]|uniref:Small, acid-soluble spore protein, alpha/beta type n=1 Tax=Sulfobacillus acidophilus (strain ATCC 700253 / DSM 10332 / NAL) TaxID=679936 RepID=G8TXM2_SULAD|nr:hypothetical protein Sulac_1481 [Sulfobacillus acidophilus DSM 10332]
MPNKRQTGKLKTERPAPQGEASGQVGGAHFADDAERQRRKLEAAEALGLREKIEAMGWGSLTAAESGRIGGWMIRLQWERQRSGAER